jgi:hypothetical protein
MAFPQGSIKQSARSSHSCLLYRRLWGPQNGSENLGGEINLLLQGFEFHFSCLSNPCPATILTELSRFLSEHLYSNNTLHAPSIYKVNSSPYLNDVAGLPSFSTLHPSPWHSSSRAFFLPIVKLQKRNLRVSFWETIEHYVSFMRPQKEVPCIKELTDLEYCYSLIPAAFPSSTFCLRPVQSVAVDTPAKQCIMVSSKTFERRKAFNHFSGGEGKKKNIYIYIQPRSNSWNL